MFFDTHCHLDIKQFDVDRAAVLERARLANVTRFVNPAYDLPSSRAAIQMAADHAEVVAAVGVHPNDIGGFVTQGLAELHDLVRQPKVVAIGEIGLDYHWNTFTPELQRDAFVRQIQLAVDLNLPVIIHCRDAYDDVLAILRGAKPPVGMLMHAFTGSLSQAESTLDLGCLLGIGGPITYRNGENIRQVVKMAPLNQLVLETDAPYLTPHPWRGKRNEPSYLPLAAKQMAEIRDLSLEETAQITTANAMRFFRLT